MTDNPQRSCEGMNSHDFLEIARELHRFLVFCDRFNCIKNNECSFCMNGIDKISKQLSLQYQKGREAGIEESAKAVLGFSWNDPEFVGELASIIRKLSKGESN